MRSGIRRRPRRSRGRAPSRAGVWRALARDTRGQSVVEFALVAPVLLTMVLGVISLGFYINAYLTVAQAVRIGVRDASLGYAPGISSGTCPDPSTSGTVCSAINAQISLGADMSASNVASACVVGIAATTGGVPAVQVSVTYDYTPVLPLPFIGGTIPMNQTYTMAQENAPSTAYGTSC